MEDLYDESGIFKSEKVFYEKLQNTNGFGNSMEFLGPYWKDDILMVGCNLFMQIYSIYIIELNLLTNGIELSN